MRGQKDKALWCDLTIHGSIKDTTSSIRETFDVQLSRTGYPGSLELDPFELHLSEMKKQIRRLPQAARNLIDKRQEIEDRRSRT